MDWSEVMFGHHSKEFLMMRLETLVVRVIHRNKHELLHDDAITNVALMSISKMNENEVIRIYFTVKNSLNVFILITVKRVIKQ